MSTTLQDRAARTAPPRLHRVVWAAIVVAALAVFPLGLLPGFTVIGEVHLGAGDDQHEVPGIARSFGLLAYGDPRYAAVLTLAAVIAALGVVGLVLPREWFPLPLILLGGLAASTLMDEGQLTTADGSPAAAMRQRAVDEVRQAAERMYAGQDPLVGIRVEAAAGWWWTDAVLVAVLLVAGVAVGYRLALPWWFPGPVLVVAAGMVLSVPGEDCGGELPVTDAPLSSAVGVAGILVFLLLVPIGIGTLLNRRSAPVNRWVCGPLCVTLGLFGALVGAFVLAAKACAFY
jgi:hypothetical protein